MKPLFFADDSGPLYGVYHPAEPSCTFGVVICPAFANEAIVSYSAMRHLATTLAARGIASLRFDYFGTGDSAGEDQDVGLMRCQADVGDAIDELLALTGLQEIVLVGIRLGANIALDVAITHDAVVGVVLLDPIYDGTTLLATNSAKVTPIRDGQHTQLGEVDVSMDGFIITPQLCGQLTNVGVNTAAFDPSLTYWITHSDEAATKALNIAFRETLFTVNESLWARSPGADMPEHAPDTLFVVRDWLESFEDQRGEPNDE